MKNKLGIKNLVELSKKEEFLSKKRAKELFANKLYLDYKCGTYAQLRFIHEYLFKDLYDFAGVLRQVNISKGGFRFAPVLYLESAISKTQKMPENTYDEIIEKYVEMNIAHPFCEGNGRSMRIWLDIMLKCNLGVIVEWSKIDKDEYLLAMQRSPIKDLEIKHLLKSALNNDCENYELLLSGIDASYNYEGYNEYKTSEL